MSTKMTDADWEITLKVFRACLPQARRQGSFVALAAGFILIKSVHTA